LAELDSVEVRAPLRAYVCAKCWLVQAADFHDAADLFTADYAYFSSVSTTWVEHARRYVESMIGRFALGAGALVIEVASNDGYLLQHAKSAGLNCVGIEPTASTAAAARAKGIETRELFFGETVARALKSELGGPKLMAANNVLAHVPDINDFVAGFREALAEDGVATFEFPHLMRLIDGGQFDTIYHEHYSYLSLSVVAEIFASNGLKVFDVEELATHGGSLRVFACRSAGQTRPISETVNALLAREVAAGVNGLRYYSSLQGVADRIKLDLLEFLVLQKKASKTVAAYGAAAKGNTLLNHAGIDRYLISFVCDGAASKQGRYLPGSHIPILPPSALAEYKPDYVLILPWNLREEIMTANAHLRDWGGKFVTAVPALEVLE
jgi:hypothetical protein